MTGANKRRRLAASRLSALLLAVITGAGVGISEAHAAQPGMGPGRGGMPSGPAGPGPGAGPGGPGGREEKKEGPAEEAPKDKEALRPIEAVPAQPRGIRRVQLFELDGYMRLRADYFHRLDLGLEADYGNDDDVTPNKFFPPPAEQQEREDDGEITGNNDASCFNRLSSRGVSEQRASTRCRRRNGFGSANMRLRLEPTLHITDSVKVHTQVDILDNVVLGSTPDSLLYGDPWAPLDLYTRSQVPPQAGINSWQDSVVVKRAYGHIRFGWGLDLQFGRRPWSWGMGLVANSGNGYYRGDKADIIRTVDQDYGDSVDSIRLAFDFGKDRRRTHTVALSWDWAASGATTGQLLGQGYESGRTIGQAFSVERFDNVYQWSLSIERRDEPDMLRRKLSLGSPVLNWGLMSWWRYQDIDKALFAPVDYFGNDEDALRQYSNRLVTRRAFLATPDLWLRVNWRTLRVELEVAGNFGFYNLEDVGTAQGNVEDALDSDGQRTPFDELDPSGLDRRIVANVGYALEFKYGFFQDRFHIGFDQGFAMGDASLPLGGNPLSPISAGIDNSRATAFRFNPAFNVDLLMFRELLGTVSNAAYFKPWAAFYFFDHFSARLDVEYALATQRISTLGNRWSYGVELDGALRYHDAREPIFVQVQYGVMFPLGAFNRLRPGGGREDARAVQTLQGSVGIRF